MVPSRRRYRSTCRRVREKPFTYVHATRVLSSPHLAHVEVFTSDSNAVHRFGEPIDIKFWIPHPQPMSHRCFGFQIFNQYQTPVICSSYFHGTIFGNISGETVLVCRFPRLLLNIGRFHLRTWLQEVPARFMRHWMESVPSKSSESTRTSFGVGVPKFAHTMSSMPGRRSMSPEPSIESKLECYPQRRTTDVSLKPGL